MFESNKQPLISTADFRSRVVKFFLLAFLVTLAWLAVGAVGFHYTADLSWEDSLYNSAMMVSTMGPVFTFTTSRAKLFASFYALTSGLVFIGTVGIAFAPIIHRFFHIFHLEEDDS
jgi:hypothetical protein